MTPALGRLLAAGCRGVGALAAPPRPAPDVALLRAAISAGELMVTRYAEAARLFEEALALWRTQGDAQRVAWTLRHVQGYGLEVIAETAGTPALLAAWTRPVWVRVQEGLGARGTAGDDDPTRPGRGTANGGDGPAVERDFRCEFRVMRRVPTGEQRDEQRDERLVHRLHLVVVDRVLDLLVDLLDQLAQKGCANMVETRVVLAE